MAGEIRPVGEDPAAEEYAAPASVESWPVAPPSSGDAVPEGVVEHEVREMPPMVNPNEHPELVSIPTPGVVDISTVDEGVEPNLATELAETRAQVEQRMREEAEAAWRGEVGVDRLKVLEDRVKGIEGNAVSVYAYNELVNAFNRAADRIIALEQQIDQWTNEADSPTIEDLRNWFRQYEEPSEPEPAPAHVAPARPIGES